MTVEGSDESYFNMAVAYFKRLDKLLYIADLCSMEGNVYGWNNVLNNVFREMCIKLTADEINQFKGKDADIIDIVKDLDNHINFRATNKICNNPQYIRQYKKQALYILNELEMKMRIMMQKRGMLLPSKDDPERAITQR